MAEEIETGKRGRGETGKRIENFPNHPGSLFSPRSNRPREYRDFTQRRKGAKALKP
jgi:hypothetical protein